MFWLFLNSGRREHGVGLGATAPGSRRGRGSHVDCGCYRKHCFPSSPSPSKGLDLPVGRGTATPRCSEHVLGPSLRLLSPVLSPGLLWGAPVPASSPPGSQRDIRRWLESSQVIFCPHEEPRVLHLSCPVRCPSRFWPEKYFLKLSFRGPWGERGGGYLRQNLRYP